MTTLKGALMHTTLTGKFAGLVDDSVFWYFRDGYGKQHFNTDLREELVERMRAFILDKDDAWQALLSIGFGTSEEAIAIEREVAQDVDEYPIMDAFLDRGSDWLGTQEGLEAALNYDTRQEAVVVALRTAYDSFDSLPIHPEQFFELIIRNGYAEQEDMLLISDLATELDLSPTEIYDLGNDCPEEYDGEWITVSMADSIRAHITEYRNGGFENE